MRARTNPVLSRIQNEAFEITDAVTYNGVALRTGILLFITFVSALFSMLGLQKFPSVVLPLLVVSGFMTFIFVLVGSMSVRLSKVMSILTAISEGLLLGMLSLVAETVVHGAIMLAMFVTLTVFSVTLALYRFRVIKVGNRFRSFMYISLLSLMIVSIFVAIMQFLLPSVFQVSWGLAVLISVALIIYGALLLIWDFDRVENMVTAGVDKRYEWTLALGLLLDIVWIYIEVIRLIILLAMRNDN